MSIVLTKEEAMAIYDLLDSLSGSNASNAFAWDGSDDISDPTTSACVKIFTACNKEIPDNLEVTK